MITPEVKEKCCGCGACESACPARAIEMRPDAEGFFYPFVDPAKCVGCDRCETVCPCAAPHAPQNDLKLAYAARTRDEEVLRRSTSGGVAFELARRVIENGGVAVGVCFDQSFRVVHQVLETVDDLRRTQGSKYVQSDTRGIYQRCEALLKEDRQVYFTGTPCQVEGLLCYLGREYDNLITQDLICHGVPSPSLWQQYLTQTGYSRADDIQFRNKDKGWESGPAFAVTTNGKTRKTPFANNPFTFFFNYNYTLRPICYACPFKTGVRRADLTAADLWGISEILPNGNEDDKGMSLLLVHTEKGKRLLNESASAVSFVPVDFKKALDQNLAYYFSMKRPADRDELWQMLQAKGWKRCYRKLRPKDPLLLAVKKKLYPIKMWLVGRRKTK